MQKLKAVAVAVFLYTVVASNAHAQLSSARFIAHTTPEAAHQALALNGAGAIAIFPAYGGGALSWVSVEAPYEVAECDVPLGPGTAPPLTCYPTSGSRMGRMRAFPTFSTAYIFIASLPERKTAFMVRRPATTRWYVVWEECVDFYACTPGVCFECPQ